MLFRQQTSLMECEVALHISLQVIAILQWTEAANILDTCGYYSEIHTLDCSQSRLEEFPGSVGALNTSDVHEIKLNHNQLVAIPDLSVFRNLKHLDISYNKITQLPSPAFRGLNKLESLDLSMNKGFILSDEAIHHEAFHTLGNLKTLKMKQRTAPVDGFDYSQVAQLNRTLEELFITGGPAFSDAFKHLTKLHTISLGGEACQIPELTLPQLASLSSLPIRRLSAKSCNTSRVDIEFLQNYQHTIEKLDLSCNPLRQAFGNITEGVRNSNLSTLIVDNINRVPDPQASTCDWYNVTNRELAPLQTVTLRVFSFQANQLGAHSNLMLRRFCTDLTYLDISLNNFNDTAFYIAQIFEGQILDDAAQSLFHNVNFQPPSLRYLGIRGLTSDTLCGEPPKKHLNCHEDSEEFLNDQFEWDANHNPDIMDYALLVEMIRLLLPTLPWQCWSSQDLLTCVINEFKKASKLRRQRGEYTASDKAINSTIRHIWNEAGEDISNLPTYLNDFRPRYLLSNLTTLSLQNNRFSDDDVPRESRLCSDIKMYPNNVVTFDFSWSEFGFVPCSRISGFPYVTNLTCNYCIISGWHSDLLSSFPLRFLHLRGVRSLAKRIQNEPEAQLLTGAPRLELLDLSEGGIEWIPDYNIFAHHPNLTTLQLQNNNLKSWNITISGNTKLSALDLRNNSINFINESFRDEITEQHHRSGLQVRLSGNDVDCSNCANSYIDWLLNSTAFVDTNNLICRGTYRPITECAADKAIETTRVPPTTNGISAEEIAVIVAGCTAIVAIVIIIVIAYNNRFCIIYHLLMRTKKRAEEMTGFTMTVYASHSESLCDEIAGLITTLSSHGIQLKSRKTDIMVGAPVKTAIVRLMVESQKVVVFLSPDSIKEELCQFEMDLLKQRNPKEIIVVGVNLDSAYAALSALPQVVADILLASRHLTIPLGICSGSEANYNAFILSLADQLRASE